MSGEHAPPMPAPEAIHPQVLPRPAGGIQFAFILPQAGYVGAAKMPIARRIARNEGTIPRYAPRPGRPPSAVRPVNRAEPRAITVSMARGPNTSAIQPAGIIMME